MSPLTEYRIQNKRVLAAITKPMDSVQALEHSRSLVHIPTKYRARSGQILSHINKPYILLASHHAIPGYEVFLGLYINCSVTVTRVTRDVHPVTGMPSNEVDEEQYLDIPAVSEKAQDLSEKYLDTPYNTFYLAQEVKVGDSIDEWSVKKVSKASGIYVVGCV